jgi:Rps23 Pro-64 3,4-dihydroxylase Tpa1-like proline 4-hydroxylase|tara:strand:- start:2123 stop:2635 length:513 start_codon:yes stop_codon:yes gene_type:complete
MIDYYENVVSEKFIDQINEYVEYKKNNSGEWRTSLYWPENIKKTSTVVPILSLEHIPDVKNYLKKIYAKLIPETENLDIKISYYLWGPLSYIPFHCDEKRSVTSTIYLNKTWDVDHGGFFMYMHEGKYNAIPPKYNSCVITTKNLLHGTTLTTTDAPFRKTLQIFFHENT